MGAVLISGMSPIQWQRKRKITVNESGDDSGLRVGIESFTNLVAAGVTVWIEPDVSWVV